MAVELSDSTLSAAARLMGANTLALTRDIAWRSGSSTAWASISARVKSRLSKTSPEAGSRSSIARRSCSHCFAFLAILDSLCRSVLSRRFGRRVVRQDLLGYTARLQERWRGENDGKRLSSRQLN